MYDSQFIDITGEFNCHHMLSTITQKQNDNLRIIHVHTNTDFVNGETVFLMFDAL